MVHRTIVKIDVQYLKWFLEANGPLCGAYYVLVTTNMSWTYVAHHKHMFTQLLQRVVAEQLLHRENLQALQLPWSSSS